MFFVADFASLCFFFSNLICCLYMSQDLRLKKRGFCLLPATQSPFCSKDTTGEKRIMSKNTISTQETFIHWFLKDKPPAFRGNFQVKGL